MTKPRLLIVDDDEDIRVQMKWALTDEYEVFMAGDRTSAVAAFTAERPVATLLDLGLPPCPNEPDEGLSVLSGLLVLDRLAKVIVVSGQSEKQNAIRAVGAGAYDFLCKPVDVEDLKRVLRRAVYVAELEREYRAIINQLPLVDVQPYLKLAHLFLGESRTGELRTVLEQSLQVEPTILAYRALGDIALRSKNPRQAAVYYEKTFSFPQAPEEQAENGTLLAVAFFRMNDLDKAEAQARRVLSLKPDHRPAVDLLSEIAAARRPQNFPQP